MEKKNERSIEQTEQIINGTKEAKLKTEAAKAQFCLETGTEIAKEADRKTPFNFLSMEAQTQITFLLSRKEKRVMRALETAALVMNQACDEEIWSDGDESQEEENGEDDQNLDGYARAAWNQDDQILPEDMPETTAITSDGKKLFTFEEYAKAYANKAEKGGVLSLPRNPSKGGRL